MFNMRSSIRITLLAGLFTVSAVMPAYSQTPGSNGNADDTPSPQKGFHNITVQLKNAVGTAAGNSDQSGIITTGHIDPQPSGGVLVGHLARVPAYVRATGRWRTGRVVQAPEPPRG